MKIKRVDILGFKSFVEKVSLDFQEGTTAILGPNGCGKSNVVDAIRWAMGEQNAKHLRGRSMEDIIFGGSESRKPHGMAEVSMIFSNAAGLAPPAYRDYAEIMVTRRLFRNGDSEYLINKTPCRLLDITELFMDTGVGARAYSIIEQGKVGMILNAKPEDRRFLIEEAAGVTKFKARKKTALRKIEATRQNLVRLGDIISEVRRQCNALKRQAQKAERYRNCREELKQLETGLALRRCGELEQELAVAADQVAVRQQELALHQAQQDQGELELAEARLRQAALEKDVIRGQEQVFSLSGEMQKVEGRIEFGRREAESLELQGRQLASEEDDLRRRLEEVDEEEAELRDRQASLGLNLQGEIRRLSEGESQLDELVSQEQELGAGLEAARGALYDLLTSLSQAGALHEEAQRRLQGLEERQARSRAEAVSLGEQHLEAQELVAGVETGLEVLRRGQESLEQEAAAARDMIRVLRQRLEENEESLLENQRRLSAQRSRLESLRQLERDLEGYGSGIKTLLGEPQFQARFAEMAADIIEVPDRYEVALEAVLGERLQTLLGGELQDVDEALAFLRTREGRCSFLLPGWDVAPAPMVPGARPLASLVAPRPGRKEQAARLLAGAFLVESLEPYCRQPLPFGVILVSEAGELLDFRGERTGGGLQGLGQGVLHKKREIKHLEEQVARHEVSVAQSQQRRSELRESLADSEQQLQAVDAARHDRALKVVDSEKDLERLREGVDRLEQRLEILSFEEDQLHEEQEAFGRQLEEALHRRRDCQEQKVAHEETVARQQEELLVVRRQADVVRESVTEIKVSVASIREREEGSRRGLERLEGLRKDLRSRLVQAGERRVRSEQQRQDLAAQGERQRTELEVLANRCREEKVAVDRLRERFEEGAGEIARREEALKVLRARSAEAREALSGLQLDARELQLELDHLLQTYEERYRLDLRQLEPVQGEGLDEEGARERLLELRHLIDGMGEVNLTAIEEYRELDERNRFLDEQQEDLRQSLEGLQKAIQKINRTTRKRFQETFDLVNARFREVFPRLFRGGQAELRLTEADDLLEAGIDIVVQPPGKKLQSVNLLSGGEKALTAVALIFSIFMIKPSPFCMLDEVDAPLDDANIGRFNELVAEMSQRSQFIIITHNKRTMEIADTLYGVTMEEPGVSKLVSVRVNEV